MGSEQDYKARNGVFLEEASWKERERAQGLQKMMRKGRNGKREEARDPERTGSRRG